MEMNQKAFCERISCLADGKFEIFLGLATLPIFRCVRCIERYEVCCCPSCEEHNISHMLRIFVWFPPYYGVVCLCN
jgi:hypothetical protein